MAKNVHFFQKKRDVRSSGYGVSVDVTTLGKGSGNATILTGSAIRNDFCQDAWFYEKIKCNACSLRLV